MESEPTPEDIAAASAVTLPARKSTRPAAPKEYHREFPQAIDAEKGALSSILLAPRDVLYPCLQKGVSRATFYLPAHGEIFQAVSDLDAARRPVDFITITQHLRDQGKLGAVGGGAYINELFGYLATAANVGYYLDILLEKYTLREIIKTCAEYSEKAYTEQEEPSTHLNNFESDVLKIRKASRGSTSISGRQAALLAYKSIEWRLDNPGVLMPALQGLGRCHAGYGVQDQHYDTVGAALLKTLRQGLGAAWTPEVEEAWAEVYGVLAGTMKEAAAVPA